MASVGSNWSRHYNYRAQVLHRPTDNDELRRIVAGAPRVRALGSRHSFSGIADSDELVTASGEIIDIGPIDEGFDGAGRDHTAAWGSRALDRPSSPLSHGIHSEQW